MPVKLLRKLFSKTPITADASADKHNTPISFEVVEPYTLGIQSIGDGFFHTLFPGAATAEPLSSTQKKAIEDVRKRLLNDATRSHSIPRLPSVIPKLLRSLRDPNASAIDYVAIINKDPMMSAAVLKLANTVYFSHGSQRITTIETGVVKLGIEGLRSVLSAAVMQPVIARNSPYFSQFGNQLWQHSLNCAVTCEQIALTQGQEPFKGYLLGLIHDIGMITVFSELCKTLSLDRNDAPSYQTFAPLMNELAAPLSHQIAKYWELPEVICHALKEQIGLQGGDHVGQYAHMLFQANLICEVFNASQYHPPKAVDKLLRSMGLPAQLHTALKELTAEL